MPLAQNRPALAAAVVLATAMAIWLGSRSPLRSVLSHDRAPDLVSRGAVLFSTQFTPAQGLGPLFNKTSCAGCHTMPSVGGMGSLGLATVTRVGRLTASGFDPMIGRGGPVARAHSVAEQNLPCDLTPGIPLGANITSVRNAPALFGDGLLDNISDEEIAAGAIARGDGVHGRVHWVRAADGKVHAGRFGWKADTTTLKQFVADAFRNELGITSPLAPTDLISRRPSDQQPCPGESLPVEDDGMMIEAVTAFIASLPVPTASGPSRQGVTLFQETGCDACHTYSLSSGGRNVPLYSDLLLHDLGPDLDDKVVQGDARGRDWRTTPLWGLRKRPRLLHDGRARTVEQAILAHGGEAEKAKQRFRLLSQKKKDVLLTFLAEL
jgi:CxxC motif-containing protein (DUF1111 family)